MTGNRKLIVNVGFFAALFLVSTAALYVARATFAEWASFNQWISIGLGGVFTVGNVGEHVAGALKKAANGQG